MVNGNDEKHGKMQGERLETRMFMAFPLMPHLPLTSPLAAAFSPPSAGLTTRKVTS